MQPLKGLTVVTLEKSQPSTLRSHRAHRPSNGPVVCQPPMPSLRVPHSSTAE
jgi:hypothetical protein